MADEKALTIDQTNKLASRVNDSDTLLVGSGIQSNTNGLTVRPAANGTAAILLTNVAGTGVLAIDTTNSRVKINTTGTAPTAQLHVAAGSAAVGTAPIKLTSGPVMSTPEDGAIEYDGTHFYTTISSTRYQLDQQGTVKAANTVFVDSVYGVAGAVRGDAGKPFTTVAGGLAAMQDGDVLHVNGVFDENVTLPNLEVMHIVLTPGSRITSSAAATIKRESNQALTLLTIDGGGTIENTKSGPPGIALYLDGYQISGGYGEVLVRHTTFVSGGDVLNASVIGKVLLEDCRVTGSLALAQVGIATLRDYDAARVGAVVVSFNSEDDCPTGYTFGTIRAYGVKVGAVTYPYDDVVEYWDAACETGDPVSHARYVGELLNPDDRDLELLAITWGDEVIGSILLHLAAYDTEGNRALFYDRVVAQTELGVLTIRSTDHVAPESTDGYVTYSWSYASGVLSLLVSGNADEKDTYISAEAYVVTASPLYPKSFATTRYVRQWLPS